MATLPARMCDGAVARSVWVKASGAKLVAAAAKREHATSFEALRTQDGGAAIGQLAGEERLTVRLVVEGNENAALEIASVPATTVNWGGSETASIEEWCALLGEVVGRDVAFIETEQTISSVVIDPTKMHELVGRTEVDWRDGMRRMVAAQHS